MKRFIFFGLALVSIWACSGVKKASVPPAAEIEVSADSVEYELVVFDPGFDAYLATRPYSKDFYSDDYYRNWNIRYCTEWNIRHANPLRYGDFYETAIPYDAHVDYGLDFNFKLYHYFQFIDEKYGIVLISRRGKTAK